MNAPERLALSIALPIAERRIENHALHGPPAVSAALREFAAGDITAFSRILAPTMPLSRHIFCAPTRCYKTGIDLLAWLNGQQAHFTMVGGRQSARSILHLAEAFRLADAAGLSRHPEPACARMDALLRLHGLAG